MTYDISVQRMAARPLAIVRERMLMRDVPRFFRPMLDQVYSAAKTNAISLDGQNVFVYRMASAELADVEFGVGVRAPFEPIGRVENSSTPVGDAATTTHWGDYGGLGAAHDAIARWCRAEQRTFAGVTWEVYGHWHDDPPQRRTDVYRLLLG